ncbi:MAG: GNAT family N-acetyltransferase [Acetatifactor sp.]|nr:GNAT family N-acetyltransferase [Acetatifactor sp.]
MEKTVGMPYEIRWARESEWAPAMKMIWRTFLQYDGKDYTQEGIRSFFEFITDDDLYMAFLRGEYQMMVALEKGRIIGAGSLRNRNHLSLLFVDGDYHHMGVGSTILIRLCEYLEREMGERYMSLRAAPYAVDFYRKLGFRTVRPEEEYSGIRVTTMVKVL